MVILAIPKILMELLREVDGEFSKRLGIEYARHALGLCAGEHVPVSFGEAIRVAGAFLDSVASVDDVVEVGRRYLEDLWASEEDLDALGKVVHLAFHLSCGKVLEGVGAARRGHTVSDLRSVARAAQVAVARHLADDRAAEGRHRWEEARWQLMALIERAPNPNVG